MSAAAQSQDLAGLGQLASGRVYGRKSDKLSKSMPAKPAIWNVVVNGAWNRAILTPDGIRRRIFDLPEATPIELEVAMDLPGTFMVGHDGIRVAPVIGRLEIIDTRNTRAGLTRAAELACRAVRSLPETPMSAAGVNIRYSDADLPDSLIDLLKADLDVTLADNNYTVTKSDIFRTLDLAPGAINLHLRHLADGSGTVEVNFHRETTVANDLCEWLARADEFLTTSMQILDFLGVERDGGL